MAGDDGVSLSTPGPAFRRRWDVFLSFRLDDNHDNFTDLLYTELDQNHVRAFRGNDGLTQGDSLDPAIFDAIEDSAAFIPIISPNYAASGWCLEELAKICECHRRILPVFYGVEPSDVRRQRGPFEEHFREHEEMFGDEMVVKWRKAMKRVGGLKGEVFMDSQKQQLIQSLVQRVLTELSNTPEFVAPYTVGLDSRVEELMQSLDVKCRGIQVLGFHGMGGVGKTTLAKALYNKLVGQFEHCSFISNIRERGKQNGLVSLQNKLIGDLSQGKMPPVDDDKAGKRAIKGILYEKRVLVVLDDIDDVTQLNALAGAREWFYEGSRIIISTRNREVLPTHLVTKLYEVRELGTPDALKLFSYHALRSEKPTGPYLSLSQKMVSCTGGLPLALEVFGSFLFAKSSTVEVWEDALQNLKQICPGNLQGVLKISFDGLKDQEKCIFLDIACLFLNLKMNRDYALDVEKGCGFRAKIAITALIERSLVKVIEDNTLCMHDQIRDMGRQIVLDENFGDPGMRSRLWDRDEVLRVVPKGLGTSSIEGVIIDFENRNPERIKSAKTIASSKLQRTHSMASALTYLKEMYKEYFQHVAEKEGELIFSTKAFEPMVNLRLLQVSNVRLEGNFKHLPAALKWLQWKKCPLKYLPSDCPRELAVLDLSESKIERVWGCRWWWCWYNNKVAKKLMVMNLYGCYNITAIPDLSGHPALEKLILERCGRLARIHKSIGDLSALRHLNLRDCSSLVKFPSNVSGLKHLENLILSGCSKLKELPQDIGSMNSLRELLVDKTAIEKLPESIFHLTKLERLSLNNCSSLKQLPVCIGNLGSLRELSLNGSALEEIPNSIGSLKNLGKLSLRWCASLKVIPDSVCNLESLTKFWLNGSSVKEMPASIGSLFYLKELSVGNCRHMSALPVSIEGLTSIVELQLDGTSIIDLPDQIGALKSLRMLEMRNCKSLRSLPETIGSMVSLHKLIIVNAAITELPESIGMLENLTMLNLNKCKLLCRLPASIGNLKSLHILQMENTALTELPESFGLLSRLIILKMAKKPWEVPQNAEITDLEVPSAELVVLPSSFSNLSFLEEFNACAWKISGKIPDDFVKLTSLAILNLGHNDFYSLPSSLIGLSNLKELYLPYCTEFKVLPPLPSSLVTINAANCTALESLSDLSILESLNELHLTNCEKLVDIPGLECLKSLRRLYMSGCNSCSSAVKGKLVKVALKNLYNLSMPGTEIPDWFTEEEVRFSKRKNDVIKEVIIAIVVCLNHQIPDDLRDQLPVLPDIQAKILRLNEPIYSTAMYLAGVPNTDEDQLYLCRFPKYHPLVSILKDGDKIQVERQNPPFINGFELKKCGIHLVFENDDDYDGDEESLDESQQSVSEKLTKFIGDSSTQAREGTRRLVPRSSSNRKNSFILVIFVVLPTLLLLLSWLVFRFVA